MRKFKLIVTVIVVIIFSSNNSFGQFPSYYQYNLLPEKTVGSLIGESSGERAFQHIVEMAGYPLLRSPQEFEANFMETDYVMARLQEYGFKNATVDRFGKSKTWQGVSASLWEMSPVKRKIADLVESPLMLASGSIDVDAEGEIVFVDAAIIASGMEGVDLKGKILLTPDRPTGIMSFASQRGAAAVVSYNSPRPLQNAIMIPAASAGGRGGAATSAVFYISPREGEYLMKRVTGGEKVVIKASAVTTMRDAELQVISCLIEGTSPEKEEVIITAHVFEGFVKTGGNDNISGSASILEAARTLKKLIDEGQIPRPSRGIRFLWVPEFSGTIPWVGTNSDLMTRTLANINLDMVGLSLAKYKSFFVLHRTSYGNAHYVGDVIESFFRYTGETNNVNSVVSGTRFFRPITAPTGTDDPFYYFIEPESGGSDHQVFTDIGVMVPGVLIITWPDPFYHTSQDLADKCDPTQLKRTVFITAASAYSIASAGPVEAMSIAAEVSANSIRRLGIMQSVASDMIAHAGKDDLAGIARRASGNIAGAVKGEKMILNSVRELAPGNKQLNELIDNNIQRLSVFGAEQAAMVQKHAISVASLSGFPAPDFNPTSVEKEAATLIPSFKTNPTSLGYGAYQTINSGIPADVREKIEMRKIANGAEALKLVDGKNSLLDIKQILDSQYSAETDIKALKDFFGALVETGILKY